MEPTPLSSRERRAVLEDSVSTVDLVSGLLDDTKELVTAHVKGARLEMRDELRSLASLAIRAAIAIVAAGVATILLALAAAHGLAAGGLPEWAGHLLVAAVLAVVAFVLIKKVKPGSDIDGIPDREIERTAHDARWLAKRAAVAVKDPVERH